MNPPHRAARFLPTLTQVFEPKSPLTPSELPRPANDLQRLIDETLALAENRLRAAAEQIIQEQLQSLQSALQRELVPTQHPGEGTFSVPASVASLPTD